MIMSCLKNKVLFPEFFCIFKKSRCFSMTEIMCRFVSAEKSNEIPNKKLHRNVDGVALEI